MNKRVAGESDKPLNDSLGSIKAFEKGLEQAEKYMDVKIIALSIMSVRFAFMIRFLAINNKGHPWSECRYF
jgi:hypothetical protein